MNKREQTLAAAVIALVALYGGYHFYGKYTKALHVRQADLEAAQKKLDEANHKLKEGHRAVRQMEAAQQRALPANFDKALSLYKAWLVATATKSGPRGHRYHATAHNEQQRRLQSHQLQISRDWFVLVRRIDAL